MFLTCPFGSGCVDLSVSGRAWSASARRTAVSPPPGRPGIVGRVVDGVDVERVPPSVPPSMPGSLVDDSDGLLDVVSLNVDGTGSS